MSSIDTQKYKFAQVFRAINNSDNPEEDFMNYVLETERQAKRGVIEDVYGIAARSCERDPRDGEPDWDTFNRDTFLIMMNEFNKKMREES